MPCMTPVSFSPNCSSDSL
uniref:Uncharacterized protein n=1 Tax=Rhizophora mucronata TaxID=61149 RepID=A0A2P2NTC4_RHIMU